MHYPKPFTCTWYPHRYYAPYDYGSSFYSFEVGPVHIIALNTYTNSDRDSKQYKVSHSSRKTDAVVGVLRERKIAFHPYLNLMYCDTTRIYIRSSHPFVCARHLVACEGFGFN